MEENRRETASVRSLRITDNVYAKLKGIQEELNLTHDAALSMLIKTFEIENSKNVIPDRATEISNFQTKVTEITEAFLYSLQINQDAEARIRGEVSLQLETKDNTIADLQKKMKHKEEAVKAATLSATNFEEKMKLAEQMARESAEKALSAREKAKDKENINSMLTGKLAEAENKLAGYDALKSSEIKLKSDLAETLQMFKDYKKQAAIDLERSLDSKQREMDTALYEIEKASSKRASEAEKKAAKEIAALEKSLVETELKAEKVLVVREKEYAAEIKTLNDRISKLMEDKSSLKELIFSLKEEISDLKNTITNSQHENMVRDK